MPVRTRSVQPMVPWAGLSPAVSCHVASAPSAHFIHARFCLFWPFGLASAPVASLLHRAQARLCPACPPYYTYQRHPFFYRFRTCFSTFTSWPHFQHRLRQRRPFFPPPPRPLPTSQAARSLGLRRGRVRHGGGGGGRLSQTGQAGTPESRGLASRGRGWPGQAGSPGRAKRTLAGWGVGWGGAAERRGPWPDGG